MTWCVPDVGTGGGLKPHCDARWKLVKSSMKVAWPSFLLRPKIDGRISPKLCGGLGAHTTSAVHQGFALKPKNNKTSSLTCTSIDGAGGTLVPGIQTGFYIFMWSESGDGKDRWTVCTWTLTFVTFDQV